MEKHDDTSRRLYEYLGQQHAPLKGRPRHGRIFAWLRRRLGVDVVQDDIQGNRAILVATAAEIEAIKLALADLRVQHDLPAGVHVDPELEARRTPAGDPQMGG